MGSFSRGIEPEHNMWSEDLTKENIERAFAKADENETGKLNNRQLKLALLEIMETGADAYFITDKEMLNDEKTLDMFVAVADRDGDNMIDLDELLYIFGFGEERPNEKELFTKIVKAADQDGNGFMTAEELKTFAVALKLDEDDDIEAMVKMFMKMGDTNGDRKLSIDEVVNFFTNGPKIEDPKEEMKRMFRMHDTNGDGFISTEEVLGFFEMMGFVDEDDTPEEARMMINMMVSQFDQDNDGKLNYQEFCKMMK